MRGFDPFMHTKSCKRFEMIRSPHFNNTWTNSTGCACKCHDITEINTSIFQGTLSQDILSEAIRLTSSDRQAIYGHPKDHFAKTIGLLNELLKDYLSKPLTPEMWPKIMICDKLARSMNKYKRDNMLDIAGYAQTHEMVVGDE